MVALRGLAAVVFGVLAFVWPQAATTAIVLLFGAYALVEGILAVALAVANVVGERRWWVLLEGITSIVIAAITLLWPGITALALVYLVATWAIVTGILQILAAIELRREIANEWLLILSGIASVVFGVVIIMFPGAGALSILWMVAAYAIVFGALLMALGFKVRKLAH
jgi:uncharacterized membrane protein HdeD (DUF308 family)